MMGYVTHVNGTMKRKKLIGPREKKNYMSCVIDFEEMMEDMT